VVVPLSDEVIVTACPRVVVWDGEERVRILFWNFVRRVRRRFVLRALPLRDLIPLEEILDTLGRVDYAERIAQIARAYGLRGTAGISLETAMALEKAHYEASYPPKAAAQAANPSDGARSSDASAQPTDGRSSTSSD
jgi:hypothetical protein